MQSWCSFFFNPLSCAPAPLLRSCAPCVLLSLILLCFVYSRASAKRRYAMLVVTRGSPHMHFVSLPGCTAQVSASRKIWVNLLQGVGVRLHWDPPFHRSRTIRPEEHFGDCVNLSVFLRHSILPAPIALPSLGTKLGPPRQLASGPLIILPSFSSKLTGAMNRQPTSRTPPLLKSKFGRQLKYRNPFKDNKE